MTRKIRNKSNLNTLSGRTAAVGHLMASARPGLCFLFLGCRGMSGMSGRQTDKNPALTSPGFLEVWCGKGSGHVTEGGGKEGEVRER